MRGYKPFKGVYMKKRRVILILLASVCFLFPLTSCRAYIHKELFGYDYFYEDQGLWKNELFTVHIVPPQKYDMIFTPPDAEPIAFTISGIQFDKNHVYRKDNGELLFYMDFYIKRDKLHVKIYEDHYSENNEYEGVSFITERTECDDDVAGFLSVTAGVWKNDLFTVESNPGEIGNVIFTPPDAEPSEYYFNKFIMDEHSGNYEYTWFYSKENDEVPFGKVCVYVMRNGNLMMYISKSEYEDFVNQGYVLERAT